MTGMVCVASLSFRYARSTSYSLNDTAVRPATQTLSTVVGVGVALIGTIIVLAFFPARYNEAHITTRLSRRKLPRSERLRRDCLTVPAHGQLTSVCQMEDAKPRLLPLEDGRRGILKDQRVVRIALKCKLDGKVMRGIYATTIDTV